MDNMKMVLDATITELWANNERKFTLSDSELPYFFYWWARRDGTVRRMVYQLLRQGRLTIVGGGWGMNEGSTTSYQSIIDSYTYSLRKLNRTFLSCAKPLVAWQSDVFGHSREYASLMAQMGFDGLFVNPISFDDELVRMDRNALEFLWRGSDDLGMETDIYTNKLFDGYWSPPGFCFSISCFDPLLVTSEKTFTNIEERVNLFISLMKFRQAPYYKTKHILVMMGSRNGYYSARTWFRNIEALIAAANEKTYADRTQVYLHYSSPHCYLKAVHDDRPTLEMKQDDFLPYAYDKSAYLTGFYTSRPDLKYFIRVGNVFLQMSKQLQVLAKLGFDNVLEDFMWIMGVVQDHNIISGALRDHAKSYYIKKLDVAIQRAMALIESGINKLRKSPVSLKYHRCEFNSSTCAITQSPSFHIIIYNSLAWRVSSPVRIPVEKAKYVVFEPNGNVINASLLPISTHVLKIPTRSTKSEHELVFIATDIPPLGFKSYFFKKIIKEKRSIIKKLSPHPQKKYYIRQAPDVYNKTYFEEMSNYDEVDDLDKVYSSKFDYNNNREYIENNVDYAESNENKKEDNYASINSYLADNRGVVTPLSDQIPKRTEPYELLFTEETTFGKPIYFLPVTDKYVEITRTTPVVNAFINEDESNTEEPSFRQDPTDFIESPIDVSETTPSSSEAYESVTTTILTSETTQATEIIPSTETIQASERSTTEEITSTDGISTETSTSTEVTETSEVPTTTKLTTEEISTEQTSETSPTEQTSETSSTEQTSEISSTEETQISETSSTEMTELSKSSTSTESNSESSTASMQNVIAIHVTRTTHRSFTTDDTHLLEEDSISIKPEVFSKDVTRTTKATLRSYSTELAIQAIATTETATHETSTLEITSDVVTTIKDIAKETEILEKAKIGYTEKPNIEQTPKYRVYDIKDESYYAVLSKDTFIENKYIKINLDQDKISSINLSNNISTSLDIQFFYYISDDPDKLNKLNETLSPGVYIFRPMDPNPVPIIDYLDTKVYKTNIVQEIHTGYADYASVVIKLYVNSPFIELDWTIGPLPEDDYGKEVFIRYSTGLNNDGVFYTDSNGRQTVKRIKNRRATYEPYNIDEIAAKNFNGFIQNQYNWSGSDFCNCFVIFYSNKQVISLVPDTRRRLFGSKAACMQYVLVTFFP
ncbi:lysosomal alpha-mannosidase-like [Pieris brassicae]|uniref:lysosomal alpha-mannosidase-like n=1 Tax=Pieris brassicae TaxID=7116 RepID=UPI001E6619ED|nr:lysosomal alpha-mannosidase-like [Pieris brassicae]